MEKEKPQELKKALQEMGYSKQITEKIVDWLQNAS
jgi:SOS response regulatory protein OraA/RecX